MMTKNKLKDLNDHLFAQMERLSDEGISEEDLEKEIRRAEAIVAVSDSIIGNANTTLKAVSLCVLHGDRFTKHLPMIEGPKTPDYRKGTAK